MEKQTIMKPMSLKENIEPKPMSLKEKLEKIEKQLEDPIKSKRLKIPRKAKVSKSKIKKGWIGIIKVDENGNFTGEKQRLQDFTIRLKREKSYHATNGSEIGLWEGKFPVIFQKTWKTNPETIRKNDEKNQIYGQKYIMARMLGDTIKIKANAKGVMWILGLGIAAYVGYALLTGGA